MDFDSLETLAEIASSRPGATLGPDNIKAGIKRSPLSAELDLKLLARRVERMALTCQVLWELLRERTNLTEEDLRRKINEVDERDGRKDGRLGVSAALCPACGRLGTTARDTCLYCGAETPGEHIFAQR